MLYYGVKRVKCCTNIVSKGLIKYCYNMMSKGSHLSITQQVVYCVYVCKIMEVVERHALIRHTRQPFVDILRPVSGKSHCNIMG